MAQPAVAISVKDPYSAPFLSDYVSIQRSRILLSSHISFSDAQRQKKVRDAEFCSQIQDMGKIRTRLR
jgi:hypothetical protein